MIQIHDPAYFEQVIAFAAQAGASAQLVERLAYLSNYGSEPERGGYDALPDAAARLAWALTHANPMSARCELYPDFAPHSFRFLMLRADGSRWFNGGLIYSGPGQPLDGSFPALTVGIGIDTSVHGWSIHT